MSLIPFFNYCHVSFFPKFSKLWTRLRLLFILILLWHFCHGSRNYKPLLLSYMIMEIINWNFYDVHMHYWLNNFLAFIIILQIRFAIVDLELHTNYVPGGSESIFDFYRRVSKGTHVVPLLLWSTGAFWDWGAGAGMGAGLGNFWKRWVRVRRDLAIKKLLKIFLIYY